MKVEKQNRIFRYSWLLTGTYHKNLAIWKLIFWGKSGKFEPFFFPSQKPLYRSKSNFLDGNLAKPQTKTKH
jgi:hypothetical protein